MNTSIWFNKKDPINELKQFRSTLGGLAETLKLSMHKIDSTCLQLAMPIEAIHKQPIGIVHGGTYCVLAETVGSVAANMTCLLYTSPSPRDRQKSRMPSSA